MNQWHIEREQRMTIDQAAIVIGALGLVVGLGAFGYFLRRSDQGRHF